MSEYAIPWLINIYVLGCVISLFWALNNYLNSGEDNVIKVLKHITWGRLLYSIVFLGGLILFYIFAAIIYLVVVIEAWFDGKNPFAFLKKQVFK